MTSKPLLWPIGGCTGRPAIMNCCWCFFPPLILCRPISKVAWPIVTKLYYTLRRSVMTQIYKRYVRILRSLLLKERNWRHKKTSKFRRYFGQLRHLIANISRVQRRCKLPPNPYLILNSGPQTLKKYDPSFDPLIGTYNLFRTFIPLIR